MALPKSQATGIENIHTATLACICSLEACLSVKPLMKEGWAENRLADMNLWASGVGALARPKASLDRRLEFQPKARLVLSNLLLTLERFIEVCRIHAMDANSAEIIRSRDEGTSTTLTNMPRVVDSESASSAESWFMELGRDIGMISDSSSDSYAEDQPAYCDHETKVKRSMDDIDDLIDQLIMLGFAIRKSGTAARLQKADKTFDPKQNADLRTYLESIVHRNTNPRPKDSTFNKGSCIHEFSLNSLPWAASLPLQGADSVTLSSPNVEEWLTGTVEKLNTEEIRDIDVTVFRPLPGQPRSPIQDPLYIPHEYFAEASKYSSQAERGSRIPSVVSTTQSHPDRPRDRRGFEIAIFCSLALEADAVEALFDRYWEDDGLPFGKEPGDPNAYCTGVIGRFNVVLVHMPAMGRFNTATVAANCGKSFPNIKLALVVGICGVVPFSPTKDEIILGDVIISDGIIQYDFGRQLPHRLVHEETLLDVLGRPNPEIRGVLAKLKVPRYRRQLSAKIKNFLDDLRQDPELHAEYPGSGSDKLFDAACRHVDNQRSCEQAGCEGKLVKRSRLSTADAPPKPMVHFGLMASGNVVMKSGEDRDRIASTDNVIAFEMEGAGVWDNFPCIIIKGGCDYADSHKNNVWHRYAAATAAACVKAFLDFWNPSLTPGNSLQAFDGNAGAWISDNFLIANGRGYDVCRHVALVGLGGMGKTQIALQLAHLMKNNEEPDQSYSVIWMPAITMEAFESECSKMICQFGVDPLPGENSKDAFKKFLCSAEAGKWFLIIDNADNFETLDGTAEAPGGIVEFIPDCEHGYILYTTRSREVAVSVAQNNVVKLSEMDDEDAKALLKSSLIEKDQMEDTILIDKLLHKLAYLPLAIIQASAYMKVNEISVNEYLRLLQNTDQDMVELLSCGFLDSAHYNSSQGAVATTWIVSFKQIRALHEDAAKVLSVTAYLEPKAIPRALLPPLSSEQKMTRAIGTLCGYSFLSKREDGETFDMNSLVHLAIKRWNEEEGLEAGTRQMAFAHIAQTFPYSDWENHNTGSAYPRVCGSARQGNLGRKRLGSIEKRASACIGISI
nr:hypothetical protein FVER53263_13503 [Fusarium verticillioides]